MAFSGAGGGNRSCRIAEKFFTGLLVFDHFTTFLPHIPAGLAVFLCRLADTLSGIPDREDGPDFYILLLGATFGTMLMASANQHADAVFGDRNDQCPQLRDGRIPQRP